MRVLEQKRLQLARNAPALATMRRESSYVIRYAFLVGVRNNFLNGLEFIQTILFSRYAVT